VIGPKPRTDAGCPVERHALSGLDIHGGDQQPAVRQVCTGSRAATTSRLALAGTVLVARAT
jgi:hypothetical protein